MSRFFLSDFPANDFNPLFANLFPGGDAAFGGDCVFSGTIAGSAFNRYVPAESLNIATTLNAVGYLEIKPSNNKTCSPNKAQ
ncbi:hypothetical protein [Methyloprofundus sedimenti]|uniref:hypothetical protein n=1 Tax=Methyloprofundus sedimenti TaxID=1420851 RepID=UPI0009B625E0